MTCGFGWCCKRQRTERRLLRGAPIRPGSFERWRWGTLRCCCSGRIRRTRRTASRSWSRRRTGRRWDENASCSWHSSRSPRLGRRRLIIQNVFPRARHAIFNLLHFQPQPHSVTAATLINRVSIFRNSKNLWVIQGSGENTFFCDGFQFWIRHRHCHPRRPLTPSTLPSWIHMTGGSSAWMYRPRNSTKDCGQKSIVSARRRRHWRPRWNRWSPRQQLWPLRRG